MKSRNNRKRSLTTKNTQKKNFAPIKQEKANVVRELLVNVREKSSKINFQYENDFKTNFAFDLASAPKIDTNNINPKKNDFNINIVSTPQINTNNIDLNKFEFDVKQVISDAINDVKLVVKKYNIFVYDDIYFNKYTNTKPSDISNFDIFCFAIAALKINKLCWSYYYEKKLYESQVCSDAFHKILRTVYSDENRANKKDILIFYRLLD
jgi:hypothetical protein